MHAFLVRLLESKVCGAEGVRRPHPSNVPRRVAEVSRLRSPRALDGDDEGPAPAAAVIVRARHSRSCVGDIGSDLIRVPTLSDPVSPMLRFADIRSDDRLTLASCQIRHQIGSNLVGSNVAPRMLCTHTPKGQFVPRHARLFVPRSCAFLRDALHMIAGTYVPENALDARAPRMVRPENVCT